VDEEVKEGANVKSGLKTPDRPGIAEIMTVLGVLSIVGGAILCALLWPRDPGAGYVWEVIAYIPALTWLSSGFISGVLFFACAAALTYLHGTREYAKAIARRLYEDVTESEEDVVAIPTLTDEEQRKREQGASLKQDSEMEEWRRQMKQNLRKLDR
jgi:hypothetical protein